MRISKYYLLLFIGLLSSGVATAQDQAAGDYVNPKSLNVSPPGLNNFYGGFGLGGTYPYSGALYTETPNLTFIYERTVINHCGPGSLNVGPVFSYKVISSSFLDEYTDYSYTQTWKYYMLGLRCTYYLHLPSTPNFDFYASLMSGYYITRFGFKSDDPYFSEPSSPGYYLSYNNYPDYLSFSVFAGIRTYISARSSMWCEVGYGYTSIAFGFCYRI